MADQTFSLWTIDDALAYIFGFDFNELSVLVDVVQSIMLVLS